MVTIISVDSEGVPVVEVYSDDKSGDGFKENKVAGVIAESEAMQSIAEVAIDTIATIESDIQSINDEILALNPNDSSYENDLANLQASLDTANENLDNAEETAAIAISEAADVSKGCQRCQ